MRQYSFFHDEKLKISLPNTLGKTSKKITDPRNALTPKSQNLPRLFVTCSAIGDLENICKYFPKSTISKSIEMSRVSLIFTSLEVENIYSAFHLFNLFLANYIHSILKSKFLKLIPLTGSQNTNFKHHVKLRKFYGRGQDSTKHLPTTLPMGNTFAKHHIFKLVTLEISKVGEDYKLRCLALKTVRNLAQPLGALGVPQKNNLYTVIRSPHVFKKTREQFVKQKYKLRIQLDFASGTMSSEFLDALVLLKLPAEIKVVIHSSL